jgi:hypothetical protein
LPKFHLRNAEEKPFKVSNESHPSIYYCMLLN